MLVETMTINQLRRHSLPLLCFRTRCRRTRPWSRLWGHMPVLLCLGDLIFVLTMLGTMQQNIPTFCMCLRH